MAAAVKPSASVEDVETVAAQCAAVTRKSSKLESASRIWSRFIYSALRDEGDDTVIDQLNNCAKSLHLPRLPRSDGQDEMTACYLSQSLLPLFDMVAKYTPRKDVWNGLISNANVGGENVHRGSILGAALGARAGLPNLPAKLMGGLHDKDQLSKEIDGFVAAVLNVES